MIAMRQWLGELISYGTHKQNERLWCRTMRLRDLFFLKNPALSASMHEKGYEEGPSLSPLVIDEILGCVKHIGLMLPCGNRGSLEQFIEQSSLSRTSVTFDRDSSAYTLIYERLKEYGILSKLKQSVTTDLNAEIEISILVSVSRIAGVDNEFKSHGWHYDIDGYDFVKFFAYLSDVDQSNGPHQFMIGSHNDNSLSKFFNRRLNQSQARNVLLRYKLKTFLGRAGTSFYENTFGYHRGLKVEVGSRIILQVLCRGRR